MLSSYPPLEIPTAATRAQEAVVTSTIATAGVCAADGEEEKREEQSAGVPSVATAEYSGG
jgi:hypothetical protein